MVETIIGSKPVAQGLDWAFSSYTDEVTDIQLKDLGGMARTGNLDAVDMLLQYAGHQSREVRVLAAHYLAQAYKDQRRAVGEAACTLLRSNEGLEPDQGMRTATNLQREKILKNDPDALGGKDYQEASVEYLHADGRRMIAYIVAKYEQSGNRTGDNYQRAKGIVEEFARETPMYGSETSKQIVSEAREIEHGELDIAAKSFNRLPDHSVEHLGSFSAADQEKGQRDLHLLTSKIAEGLNQDPPKDMVAAWHSGSHFVSVIVRGGEICIVDTAPSEEHPLGESLRNDLTVSLIEEKVSLDGPIKCVSKDIQNNGFPNCCGPLNLILYQELCELEATGDSLEKDVERLVTRLNDMPEGEKLTQNDSARFWAFATYLSPIKTPSGDVLIPYTSAAVAKYDLPTS